MQDKPRTTLAGWLGAKIDRRRFLKTSAALAGSAAVGGALLKASRAAAGDHGENDPDSMTGYSVIRSTCQMCHGRCGIAAKVKDGVLLKIDGNPYHPATTDPDERVPYATDPESGDFGGVAPREVRGRLCPKGQAGIQTLYNPYRLTGPVKRVGARGAGQWEPISWTQAFTEIAARMNELIPTASRNTTDVDASLTQLGKIANQLAVSPGRTIEDVIWERTFKSGYGTANWRLDHTSICEESHHIAGRLATTGGYSSGKHSFKGDHAECQYAVVIGANPLEACFAMVPMSRGIANMKASGGKLVVVDPRFSNTATKADKWVPVKPGMDGAFAMGLARVILENDLHTAAPRDKYLFNANKAAANADSEPTYSDATWLVITDGANKGRLLSEALLSGAGSSSKYYAWSSGAEVGPFDPADTTTAVEGELLPGSQSVTGAAGTFSVKTVFELYREEVYSRSLAEWAVLCGVPEADLEEVATELTNPAYGRSTAIWWYRGACQHTNGTMNSLALECVASLVASHDHRGGLTQGAGGYTFDGTSGSGAVNVKTFTGAVSTSGPRIDRAASAYSSFSQLIARDGYPALRPWFPFAQLGTFQEVIPGIQDQYPYPIKVLITSWNAFPYSTPALKEVFRTTVSDETLLPLFVAIDPIIGENSAYADYILPDTTYLEKWTVYNPGNASELVKVMPLQQPVVGQLDGVTIGSTAFNPNATNAYTSYMGASGPKMLIDILHDLAVALGLPGVGTDAIAAGKNFDRAWDFAKQVVTNGSIVTGASVSELISRGGYFQDSANMYADFAGTASAGGAYHKNRWGGQRRFYYEALVTTKTWYEDAPYAEFGIARYEPVAHLDGTPVADAGYPYRLITYKSVLHGQARTHVNPWLMALQPQNYVELSSSDAHGLGVATGDTVRVRSASDPVGLVGKAKVIEGLRPGVVAISHHYGHWEGGARPQVVDGHSELTARNQESWRGAGITANPIMRADDMFPNVSLEDRLGGSVAFHDTHVAIERVAL